MPDQCKLFRIRLGSANVQFIEKLPGISIDDFGMEMQGKLKGKIGFTDGCRASYND